MTSGPAGPPPAEAVTMFSSGLASVVAYADRLAVAGIERGLLGPREVPVLWTRHVMNSALVAELVPEGSRVVDVGSGAGLPGIPLAIARPDLSVVLLEPLLRRSTFLAETVESLGLADRVSVVRGRAGEPGSATLVGGVADVVTARAVAPLERLVRWCLPLVAARGRLLALKGERATEEVVAARPELRRLQAVVRDVVEVGDDGSHVVVVERQTGRRA